VVRHTVTGSVRPSNSYSPSPSNFCVTVIGVGPVLGSIVLNVTSAAPALRRSSKYRKAAIGVSQLSAGRSNSLVTVCPPCVEVDLT
jgi:hypothetical protein